VSVYGETKLVGEKMIREFAGRGEMHAAVLRYFNASGADPDGEAGECHNPETHLLPLVIRAAQDSSFTLKVFGDDYPTSDGTCIRDYTHVTDLAVAHAQALDWSVKTKTPFEAFNLGTGHGSSVLEVIRAVEEFTKTKVKYTVEKRREGDADVLVADIGKARSVLGWEPMYSDLATVVRTACKWHRK
jgi:UDP-glucose 4-epimerase